MGNLNREDVLRRLEKLRVIDDTFMRRVFKDNLPLAQHVLRILTNIDTLVLTREETQRDLKQLAGSKSVILDVWGTDENGTQYDMEVQADGSFHARRARYYSAAMDVDTLSSGDDYCDLPDQMLIVIANKGDFDNRPLLHYVRFCPNTGKSFGDGSHILYI